MFLFVSTILLTSLNHTTKCTRRTMHTRFTLTQPITTPVAGRANTAQPSEDTGTPSFSPLPARWTPTVSRHQIPQQEEQEENAEEESETSSSSSSSSSSRDSSPPNSPIPLDDQVTHPAHACVRPLF